MKCEDIKNLILETSELNKLVQDTQFREHLSLCSSCKEQFEIEQRIRIGFETIASKSPPPTLFKAIVDIQQENQQLSIFKKLQKILFSFTFKVSFASCLAGFLLALALTYPGHITNKQKQVIIKAESKTDDKIAMHRKTSVNTFQVEAKAPKPSVKLNVLPKAMYYVADDNDAWTQKADEAVMPVNKQVDDVVAPVRNSKTLQPHVAVAPQHMARMKLAMAPKPAKSKILRKAMLTSFSVKSKLNRSDTFDNFAPEKTRTLVEIKSSGNAIAKEIKRLIITHNIKVSTGYINIKKWETQGIITFNVYIKLSPPLGKSWFVEKKNNSFNVLLKKK